MLIATLGEGFELRLMELRYLPAYHRLSVKNYARLYWLPGEPALHDSERRIRDGLAQFVEGRGVDAGIFAGGELRGFVGLFHIDSRFKSAEIGYWLDAEAEGQGLARRAASALLDYAFTELGLHRVDLRCAATNARSIRLAERLGFSLEGRQRKADEIGGEWLDLLCYGLLDEEWRGQQQTRQA